MINDIIQLLGVANPQLSSHWSNGAPQNLTSDGTYGLTCAAADNFVAPFNGYLSRGAELERIVMPGGGTVPDKSFLIKADPQVYLRMTRLYATIIEGKQAHTHLPERPVPCYFVYTNLTEKPNGDGAGTGPKEGLVLAGADLVCSGKLSIHDQYGYPIDPLAVAAAFDAFMAKFATMETKPLTTPSAKAPVTAGSQLKVLAGTTKSTTIQLSLPNGDAFTGGLNVFNNLADINSDIGLYGMTTAIGKNATAGATLKIGAATNGLLADNYKPSALAAGLTLGRDFLRAYVVQLDKYLLGDAPATEPSIAYGVGPVLRDGEQITLLADGTECLGAVGTINASGGKPLLLVSPVIDKDFVLPTMAANGSIARWPAAPAVTAGMVGSIGSLPANLNATFALSAAFISDDPTVNSDVALQLSSPLLVPGDWVRIYNRLFHDDGSETRGNGAGAMIDANHTASFRLSDPFSLITAANQAQEINGPKLMLDVVVINRGGRKRTFGNIQCIVGTKAPLPPQLAPPDNLMLNKAELGTSPAGIFGTAYAPQNAAGGNAGDFLKNMLGENQPRQAPRYPTMARYDSIAASYNTGAKTWQAFCGGTIFKKDALSSFPFLGNPGNPGGRELSSVGIYTTGGVLAYDLARAAYRRTRNIGERIIALAIDPDATTWQTPAADTSAGATWAAAALQTIAAHCETPELGLKFTDMSGVPATFSDFVKLIENKLGGLPSWLPNAAKTKLQAAIDSQGSDAKKQQGYAELYREIVTSINGRRDTFWALKQALLSARECIYIQGSLLDRTAYTPADDLVEMLSAQLKAHPRLKLILCFSRQLRYGKGYEAFEAHDYQQRMELVTLLRGEAGKQSNQVIAFHPNGFPMRPKELRHQLVIVDDMWMLIGSSSFRRRGLQFDGSQDVAALDKAIVNGKSAGIRAFRIKLLEEHLNLQNSAGLTPGLQVRLRDLRESFYAIKELLDSGGAGLISPLWEGDRLGLTPATDDLANPGASLEVADAMITALLSGASTAP